MSIDIKQDTITVDGTTYTLDRDTDRNTGTEVLTIEEFPGLEAKLGSEDYIEDWMSPRDMENSLLGVMITQYRGHNFGIKGHDEFSMPTEDWTIDCPVCKGLGEVDRTDFDDAPLLAGETPEDRAGEVMPCTGDGCDNGTVYLDPASWIRHTYGARVILPLYVYEHGGITMSAGAPIPGAAGRAELGGGTRFISDPGGWDTSTVGFIFDTPDTLKACGWEQRSDEEIAEGLDQEIQSYASFLEGDVTYYHVEDPETGYYDGCGGYLGDYGKHAEHECFESLETAIERRLREQTERAEWAARDVETV